MASSRVATPVRRSRSSGVAAGDEIPLTSSMELLTLGQSEEGTLTVQKDGTSRPKTPAGAAPPPSRRRSQDSRPTSATGASVLHIPVFTDSAADGQEAMDPWLESPREVFTPASVQSGRVGRSEVFFTALRRQSSDNQSVGASERDLEEMQRSQDLDAASSWSRHNPMQSPTASGWLSDEDKEQYDDDLLQQFEVGVAAGSSICSEFSNPMMSPSSSVRSSAVIPAHTHHQLMQAGVSGSGGVPHDGAPGLSTGLEPEVGVQHSALHEEAGALSSSSSSSSSSSEGDPAGEPAGQDSRELDGPVSQASSTSEAQSQNDKDEAQDTVDSSDASDEEGGAGGMRSLRDLEAALEGQHQRRAELELYMSRLHEHTGEDGAKLVELPRSYAVMVEEMIRQQRGEHQSLQGWLGPHRYSDLPIAQLPEAHEDPRVNQGLQRIRELDRRLTDQAIEAMVVARETFPEKFEEHESRRLQSHANRVEELLKKERKKRLRAARLTRALSSLTTSSLDSEASSSAGTYQGADKPNTYSRFYGLKPEEEALVEAVLARPSSEAEADPFATPGGMATEATDDGQPVTLAAIEAKLEMYSMEHEWDEAGSLCDFRWIADGVAEFSSSEAGRSSQVPAARSASVRSASLHSHVVSGKHDYLREMRTAKELRERQQELDARIISLRTAEPPGPMPEELVKALVAECLRLQEAFHRALSEHGSLHGDASPASASCSGDARPASSTKEDRAKKTRSRRSSSASAAGATPCEHRQSKASSTQRIAVV